MDELSLIRDIETKYSIIFKNENILHTDKKDNSYELEEGFITNLKIHIPHAEDFKFLKFFKKLRNLILSGNGLRDISFVSELSQLKELSINHNNIADLSPLNSLDKLIYLNASNNHILKIPKLNLSDLTRLSLAENKIIDISQISSLSNLTHLWIHNNPIENISIFNTNSFSKLQHLVISDTKVKDISPIKNLLELKLISFENINLNLKKINFNFFAKLTHLKEIYLSNNNISSLDFLSNNINLESIIAINNEISSLDFLHSLLKINLLKLKGNRITAISIFDEFNFPNLNLVELDYNQIKNLAHFSGTPALRKLDLSYNQISDASPLQQFPDKENIEVFLSKNPIIPSNSFSLQKRFKNISIRNYTDLRTQIWSDHILKKMVEKNIVFSPRKTNIRQRLSLGYWFLGNGDYIAVGFNRGTDYKQKTYNLNLVFLFYEDQFIPANIKIEINFTDEYNKDWLRFYYALVTSIAQVLNVEVIIDEFRKSYHLPIHKNLETQNIDILVDETLSILKESILPIRDNLLLEYSGVKDEFIILPNEFLKWIIKLNEFGAKVQAQPEAKYKASIIEGINKRSNESLNISKQIFNSRSLLDFPLELKNVSSLEFHDNLRISKFKVNPLKSFQKENSNVSYVKLKDLLFQFEIEGNELRLSNVYNILKSQKSELFVKKEQNSVEEQNMNESENNDSKLILADNEWTNLSQFELNEDLISSLLPDDNIQVSYCLPNDVDTIAQLLLDELNNSGNTNTETNGKIYGILGRWGRGKTTIAKAIEEKTKKTVVKYSAWKYQDTSAAWAYIYEVLLKNYLENSNSLQKLWKIFCLNSKRKKLNTLDSLFFIIPLLTFLTTLITSDLPTIFNKDIVVAISTFVFTIKVIHEFLNRLQVTNIDDIVKDFFQKPSFEHLLGLQAEIQIEIKHLLEAWGNEDIILIIDDIDRCKSENMMDIIDAARVILDDPSIDKQLKIIAAIETKTLRNIVYLKYKNLIDKICEETKNGAIGISQHRKERYIFEYLDKIFIQAIYLGELTKNDFLVLEEKHILKPIDDKLISTIKNELLRKFEQQSPSLHYRTHRERNVAKERLQFAIKFFHHFIKNKPEIPENTITAFYWHEAFISIFIHLNQIRNIDSINLLRVNYIETFIENKDNSDSIESDEELLVIVEINGQKYFLSKFLVLGIINSCQAVIAY